MHSTPRRRHHRHCTIHDRYAKVKKTCWYERNLSDICLLIFFPSLSLIFIIVHIVMFILTKTWCRQWSIITFSKELGYNFEYVRDFYLPIIIISITTSSIFISTVIAIWCRMFPLRSFSVIVFFIPWCSRWWIYIMIHLIGCDKGKKGCFNLPRLSRIFGVAYRSSSSSSSPFRWPPFRSM